MENILADLEITAWLMDSLVLPRDFPRLVLYEGFGPFVWDLSKGYGTYFQEFLDMEGLSSTDWDSPFTFEDLIYYMLEIEVMEISDGLDFGVLIVGRYGWSKENLSQAILTHAGKQLRVYSEEMFLMYMITGNDPFAESPELIHRFGKGHPALEYLMNIEIGFDWPSTKVAPRIISGEFPSHLLSKGLLKHLGYRVGKSSRLSSTKRHQILENVYRREFTQNDYQTFNPSYLQEWGQPKSPKRLQKLAITIATLCKLEKSRKKYGDYHKAITDREDDLDWLKKRFYTRRSRFKWPDTHVY